MAHYESIPKPRCRSRCASKPYSKYNIFFRLDRMRILQSYGMELDEITAAKLAPPDHYDPYEHPRPRDYINVRLPAYWYSATLTGKSERKHQKCPGRIDMLTLSKIISKNWSIADPEVKDYCGMLAKTDALLFRKEALKQKHRTEKESLGNKITRGNYGADDLGRVSKGVVTQAISLSTMNGDNFNSNAQETLSEVKCSSNGVEKKPTSLIRSSCLGLPMNDHLSYLSSFKDCHNNTNVASARRLSGFVLKIPQDDSVSSSSRTMSNMTPHTSLGPNPEYAKYPSLRPYSNSNTSSASSQHSQHQMRVNAAFEDASNLASLLFGIKRNAGAL